MSMITVVTRIFPITAVSEDTSYLLNPSELGKPIEVHKCLNVDPRTGMKYVLETTFCLGKSDDLGNLNIPGLIPLTGIDCALNYEEENIGKEFAFSLPRNIPLHKIPQLQKVIELEQKPTIKLHLNLKKIREATKKKILIKKKEKLVQPLLKYFVNNECLICGTIINKSRKNKITKHMFSHIKLGTYACQSCENKCFPSAEALYSHSLKHVEKKQYSCNVCSQKFNRKYFLLSHYNKKHLNLNSKPASYVKKNVPTCFVCTICKTKLPCWKSLGNHKNAHFGKENYLCLFCNKTFTTSSLLRYHAHLRFLTKRYQCRSCHKTFLTGHQLQKHESTHSKQYMFACQFCPKKFNFNRNLLGHVQLLHSSNI